jgi:hypothetical protein
MTTANAKPWNEMFPSRHAHLAWDEVSLFMEEDFFANLIERVEIDLQRTIGDFHARCEAETSGMSAEDREHYGDGKCDVRWELSEVAPRIMRRSLLALIYGTLENRLKRLCHAAHADGLCADAPTRGKWYINQSQVYLMTKIGLPQTNFEQRWTLVNGYRAIRNIVVHNDGILSGDEQSATARLFIKQTDDIDIEDEHFILIERNFCKTFAAFASCFLHDLLTEMKKRPTLGGSDGV